MTGEQKATNVVWHAESISRADRERQNGHRSAVLWFTGLSGSGKSTLAQAVQAALHDRGCRTYVLDGDNIRHGLNRDLGFTPEDRVENIRRIGEVARLFVDAGVITLTAFISPYREDRARARAILGDDFIEVYVKCDLEEAERRDPKGLYKRARAGEIANFTGIHDAYEAPENPELLVDTTRISVREALQKVLGCLAARGVLRDAEPPPNFTP